MTEKSKFERTALEFEITDNYLFCVCRGGRTVLALASYCGHILKGHLNKTIWSW